MNRTFDIKIISKPIDTNISGPLKSIRLVRADANRPRQNQCRIDSSVAMTR
ncbi:hypothetical protein X945_4542 [Burkholderia pseudomallei ABCPW 107]|nr:hypothetical protein X945_4542 [Burkholderia pseudomallei ABCPW 107]